MLGRRELLKTVALAAGATMVAAGTPALAQDQSTAQIGLIAPMSGPWARQGELMRLGAELAIKDINESGGIKALGGMPMELVIFDAGDSAEKAKNAAQRMVSQYPDLVGVTGSWLSSFTLAVSEVTERAEIPMLTLSYSDQITNRGFHYIFQMPMTANEQAKNAIPALLEVAKAATGEQPTTTGIIADNTASSESFASPIRGGELDSLGLELKFDETFTPPLADATALVQRARSARPEFMLMLGTAVPDDKLLLEKVNEFGLGGGRMPIIASGAHMGAPELLKNVGPDLLEGVMTVVGNWAGKGSEEMIARFTEETGEPWMTQDSIATYGDLMVFKEALEAAGEANPKAVAEAIRAMDVTDGPAQYYPGGHIKFDDRGRNTGADLVIIQWQNGKPVPIYPDNIKVADPVWPTR